MIGERTVIKVYCNKCGTEITGNVNVVVETVETKDCYGNVITTLKGDTLHYCDECQYEDLTCGFKVGDQVITDDGRVGTIISICDCKSCKKRGFYEPSVEMEIGDQVWITDTDKRKGFDRFYRIGDRVFGNLDELYVIGSIDHKKQYIHEMEAELIELEKQLDVVKKLKEEKEI